MMEHGASVTDRNGLRGTLRPSSGDASPTVVLEDGGTVRLRADRLVEHADGGYRYDGDFKAARASSTAGEVVEEHRLTVAREELKVGREERETGRVRIRKRVHERTETVDEPVFEEDVDVRRVPVDRVVEEAVPVRQEGDTTVVPVLEERLVVTRQLVLKEEIHITRRRSETRATREVALRGEDVSVEREDAHPGDASRPASTSRTERTDRYDPHE